MHAKVRFGNTHFSIYFNIFHIRKLLFRIGSRVWFFICIYFGESILSFPISLQASKVNTFIISYFSPAGIRRGSKGGRRTIRIIGDKIAPFLERRRFFRCVDLYFFEFLIKSRVFSIFENTRMIDREVDSRQSTVASLARFRRRPCFRAANDISLIIFYYVFFRVKNFANKFSGVFIIFLQFARSPVMHSFRFFFENPIEYTQTSINS